MIIDDHRELAAPLNEYGDSQILFQKLSFYNMNNRSVKFDKNPTAGYTSEK